MFENRQDTTLLRDSLISAKNFLKSKEAGNESYTNEDKEAAAKIIASTISTLTCNLYGVNSVQELFKKQTEFNRRCHATVFINLLKSQNIISPEANSYYQSVLYDLPYFDWSLYLKLNFLCRWSEYFIECAQQLQPNTLSTIQTKLLEVVCDGELMYFTWHLVLQSFIWRTFTLHSPILFKPSDCCLFQFNFSVPETLPEVNPIEEYIMKNSITGRLPQIYNVNLKKISGEMSHGEIDMNCIKVLFHGLKTLFRLVNIISDCEGPCMEKFNQLNPLFALCLQEDAKAVVLKNLNESNECAVDFCYQTMSWDINGLYLMFLLENFWKDITERPSNRSLHKSVPKTISDYRSEFKSLMKEKNLSYKSLVDLKDSYLNISKNSKRKYLQLLSNVITYHYPCASRAAEYLLSDSAYWEPYKICDLLDQNMSVLDSYEIHSALADAIVKTDSEEYRERFLNIFYKILSSSSPEIYDDALKNILNKWGFCQHFKLSEFDSQLTHFTYKTVSLKEAEESFLPLFIQSPKVVLQFLIDQVLMQGEDSMEMMQILKTVPFVCLYESRTEQLPLLISLLHPYFQLKLETQEANNFLLLIKIIAEIEATEDIFSFDLLLEKCILPNTNINNIEKLNYNLDCLSITLDELMHKHALEMSSKSFSFLIQHLGKIMSFCIENGLAQLKEKIIGIFILLSKYKKKPPYNKFLKVKLEGDKNVWFGSHSNAVALYVLEIFTESLKSKEPVEVNLLNWGKQIIQYRSDLLWICCCLRNNTELFAEKINLYNLTYVNLLKCLTPLLWHFTSKEWGKSTELIMHYVSLLKSDEKSYPWLLADNDPALYGVIRCLIDCFTILVYEKSSEDLTYISACFTNTILNFLNNATAPPHLLLNVFLDVCHLVSLLSNEKLYNIFSTFLINLLKKFHETCDQKDCLILFKLGIDNFPNSVEKNCLLKYINKV